MPEVSDQEKPLRSDSGRNTGAAHIDDDDNEIGHKMPNGMIEHKEVNETIGCANFDEMIGQEVSDVKTGDDVRRDD